MLSRCPFCRGTSHTVACSGFQLGGMNHGGMAWGGGIPHIEKSSKYQCKKCCISVHFYALLCIDLSGQV